MASECGFLIPTRLKKGPSISYNSTVQEAERFKIANALQECEDFMAQGIVGTGEGFDVPAAGKVGGRYRNPSAAERHSIMLKANYPASHSSCVSTE